jgi:preprotein translocase subunit SecD
LVAGVLFVGCSADDKSVSLELRIVEWTPSDDLTEMTMKVWGGQKTYYAHSEVLLTEADVTSAAVVEQNGAPSIELVFDGEAREKLARVTRHYVGHRLGIIIDGELQCAPHIEEPIESGVVIVTGHMLEPTARRFSRSLTRQTDRQPRAAASLDT